MTWVGQRGRCHATASSIILVIAHRQMLVRAWNEFFHETD